jgi:hypothetical protein
LAAGKAVSVPAVVVVTEFVVDDVGHGISPLCLDCLLFRADRLPGSQRDKRHRLADSPR